MWNCDADPATSSDFKLRVDTQRESRFFGVTVNWIANAKRQAQTQSDVVVAYPKIDTGANGRVVCGVDDVTQEGADWYVRSWSDMKLIGASAQWIAIGLW
jgi:hypothetical protein